jgi:pSer/pThr/pTyr-binding forkhead associated (FHA) protein
MRLIVKRGDNLINEARFTRGPIYIGRQIGSQIFLPDRAVSRQNTVLYTTTDGKWVAEDLDSANKTYLNKLAIHKAEIKNGDIITISDFEIEVLIDDSDKLDTTASLDDTLSATLSATLHDPQIVIRHLEGTESPLIRMQSKRAKDFSSAASIICKCKNTEELAAALLDLLFRQFRTLHCWVALRKNSAGAMEIAKGKKVGGLTIKLEELYLEPRINEAVKNQHYILVPRLPMQYEGDKDKINSAIITPIICDQQCFGVLYADNSLDHEHYGISDLDYLILISFTVGAFVKNL